MKVATKAQRKAIKNLWLRAKASDHPDPRSYKQFRESAVWAFYDDCMMFRLWNMWIGIEKDGYTHS